MTHAESQDLLLDLAYGELDPARAAELEGHLAGCAECQREKAALDEARRLSAPLRELEEPSPGFDERVLQAAKAQAQLDHGSTGQVIEVTGSVRPLGVEPARIDAHGGVPQRREPRKPRWMMRVALGGSVAAAAALALVVSTSLQTRKMEEAARLAQEKSFEIRVQPAPLEEAVRDAVPKAAPAPRAEPAAPEPLQAEQRPAAAPKLAKKSAPPAPAPAAGPQHGAVAGSGGDANVLRGAGASAEKKEAQPQSANDTLAPEEPPPPPPEPRRAVAAAPAATLKSEAPAAVAQGTPANLPAMSADELERQAETARHAGDYLRAATLYRQAADALRNEGGNRPAWDLAHAVECLAAAGQFAEAKTTRAELQRLYPAETSAFSAARRALREVDTPAKPASKDASIPAEF